MRIFYLILLLFLVACSKNNNNNSKKVEHNILIVHQLFDYFNKHEWQKMADLYIDTAMFKDPSLGPGIVNQSKAEIIKKYTELESIFPNIQDEVVEIYPSGENHVIVEFVSSGTALDGSEFELPICTIFTFENGKIIKDFNYYDDFEE